MLQSQDVTSDRFPLSYIETLKSMIQARGYFYTEKSIENAKQKGKGKTTYTIQYRRKDKTLTILFLQQNTEKKQIKKYVNTLGKNDQLIVIFLSNDYDPSRLLGIEDDRVSTFNVNELAQNILLHQWVPKHQKVDKKEISYIKHIYQLATLDSLPLISHIDPVVKFNGWRCGDVIRITRKPMLCPRSLAATKNIGSGCGTYSSYRYVSRITE